jgi:hypothetical protein
VEWRRREPLIDPRFFASAPFSGAAVIAVAAFAALAGFLFLNTLYLQTARGYSAIEAGLLILPMAATNAVTARLSGRLVAAGRARWALVIAGVAITAGSAILITVGATAPVAELVVVYIDLSPGRRHARGRRDRVARRRAGGGRVHRRQPRRLGRRRRVRAGRAPARLGVDERLGPCDRAADP